MAPAVPSPAHPRRQRAQLEQRSHHPPAGGPSLTTTILGSFLLALSVAAAAQPPQVAESLGPPAARFVATERQRIDLARSWAIETAPAFRLAPDPTFAPIPTFTHDGKWHRATIAVNPDAHLLGLGPTPGPLRRNGLVADTHPIADAIAIALSPDGSALAAIADTPHPVHADLTQGIRFRSNLPFAVIVIRADSLSQLLTHLAELTGRVELPPRWAFDLIITPAEPTQAALTDAIDWAQSSTIHPGGIWLSCAPPLPADNWPGSPVSDWPNLRDRLAHANLRPLATLALAPLDDAVRAAALRGDHLLSTTTIPDFDQPRTRQWWSLSIARARTLGIAGLIVPQVQPSPQGSSTSASRSLILNHARASFVGIGGETTGQRAVLISPTLGIGSVRAGARSLAPAPDTDPAAALRDAISSALAGQPLVAAHLPAVHDDRARQRRWLATMSLLPILLAQPPSNPQAAADLADALRLRAALTPYLYTQLFFAFLRCEPPIRPLIDLDPADASLLDLDSAFLLGRDLLIATNQADPRLAAALARPGLAGWKRLEPDADSPSPDWLPAIFIRPGSIVPIAMPPTQRAPSSPALNALILVANLPDNAPTQPQPGTPAALGRLYEDIGEAHHFMNNAGRIITYRIDLQNDRAMLRLAGLDGGWSLPRRPVIARVFHRGNTLTALGSEAGTIAIPLRPAPPAPPVPPAPAGNP